MSGKKTIENQLHVGRDGTPRKCVAQPGNCPLAHPLAHGTKLDEVQSFADKYNELKVEGKNFMELKGERDVKELEDAEIAYISDEIKENAPKYDNYDIYYNQARWQKTNRNNALKEMKVLELENDKIIEELENKLEEISNTDDKKKKRELRKEYNKLWIKYAPITQKNEALYEKAFKKKQESENKMMNFLEKRAFNLGVLELKDELDEETNRRLEMRK